MSVASLCPPWEELAGIGADTGTCPPELAAHIDQCMKCRDVLRRRVDQGLDTATGPAMSLPDQAPRIPGYTIERELGRGGMGIVYLANCDRPRRRVALKLLPGGRRASSRERRQWLREAEEASLVRHAHVVTLYDVGEADDWFFLVLEYIPGGTLADRLSNPLLPADAAALIETVARAVHCVHLHGQLHLDLKPSNILLDGDARAGWEALVPKVSDFGIARSGEPTATSTVEPVRGGTPPYMAPEQITSSRGKLSPGADIHALGAILYHALTGRPPYQGATVLDTLEQVRNNPPVPPRRLIPQIPRDLETIVLKCLEKKTSARYVSADALANDLRSWLEGRPISARPVSLPERLGRWCRRRPALAALATSLTLTILIGFPSVVLLWRHAEQQRTRAENEGIHRTSLPAAIGSGRTVY